MADSISPLGNASVIGKSGRVIEKLMTDVDRLTRELRLAMVKFEEEQRRSDSVKAKLESLQNTNVNLEAICSNTEAALARRDRKIDDLRINLEAERHLRQKYEQEKTRVEVEAEIKIRRLTEESLTDRKIASKASSEYQILRESFQTMQNSYRSSIENLSKDVKSLRSRISQDQDKFERLEDVCAQLQTDQACSNQVNMKLVDLFDNYRVESQRIARNLIERAEMGEAANDCALRDLHNAIGEVRYLENLRSIFGRNESKVNQEEGQDGGL